MSTRRVNSAHLSTGSLVSGIIASVVGAIYIGYSYLYNAADCTGTGTACNRTFACTLSEDGLCLFVLANFLFLPFVYWLFQRFGVKPRYWIPVWIAYGL